MSEQKLTNDQRRRINAIMNAWHEDIDRISETPRKRIGTTFSCHDDALSQKPYEKLRDKYMPMIQKIKEESIGEG